MTCDACKTAIAKGEPYSLTEHGRLHSRCLRAVARPSQAVQGPLLADGTRAEPVYVLRRM